MKKVEAIIRPFKLDAARDALEAIGVPGITASEVNGFGRQQGRPALYRGAEYVVGLLPKIKLEMAVPDDSVEKVARAILDACDRGRIGDGKIFVSPLADTVRIRTCERGDEAL